MPPQFEVISLFDAETVMVESESLRWIPVRRRLGIGAFGINAYRADAGEPVIEEHFESPGHEELYVVLRGRIDFKAGGESVELGPGEAAFIADPDLRRGATAIADESAVLAIGGWRDRAYHPLPWEPLFLADAAFSGRRWQDALEILEREAGEHRENGYVRYRIACCLAQLGRTDDALAELRAALDTRPELRERAAADEFLKPLRELEDLEGST
jgi:tetratricopeptide (TPR) repeat protein